MADKKKYDIKTKGVTFNLLDPDQVKLFEHASKRQNFSGYVKRLIQRDLEGKLIANQNGGNFSPPAPTDEDTFEMDESMLNGLI